MRDEIQALIAQLQHMPEAMKTRPQWLVWRFAKFDGDKKPRKLPCYVNGNMRGWPHGRPPKKDGKVTPTPEQPNVDQGHELDRQHLVGFDGALSALRCGKWDGVGFAFLPGDGLIGIDIDHAIDPETGEVSDRCAQILAEVPSYTEFSPSGTGLHIIVEGQTTTFKSDSIGVEVFCNAQFFTCTGRRWSDSHDAVRPIGAEALAMLKAMVEASRPAARAKQRSAGQAQSNGPGEISDFKRVNSMALTVLDAWVPSLLPQAVKSSRGYRVRQADLPGRSGLEEDLSITPEGIVDFGVHDMGDAQQGKRTAIDLVMEWRGLDAGASLTWLASQIGVQIKQAPQTAKSLPAQAAGRGKPGQKRELRNGGSTPSPGSAEEASGVHADDWRRALLGTGSGGLKDCRENIFHILSNHPELKGLVAFDEFAYRVVKLKPPPWPSAPGEWTNNDDYELGLWLSQREGLTVKAEGTLAAGVAMAAYRAKFHPVLEYLNPLEWDGVDRLKHWVHECLGGEDSTYHQMVGTWYVMGMVNRILSPGCQMDNMITLEGGQGEGKSTSLRVLAGEWFADTPLKIGDKDAILNLAGKWLYEIAEMDSFNRAEVTAVKQYITSRVDRVREPYTRRPADRPRTCVLGGTTNQGEYLKDSTGARRFWPIAVRRLDLKKLASWRDQMFAEAKHLLANGERYWPTKEEERLYIIPEQEDREIIDPWLELIAIWVDGPEQMHIKRFTSAELLTKCINVPSDRIDGARSMATRIGMIMHKLGWKRERQATGKRLWYYLRPADETAIDPDSGGPGPVMRDEIDGVPF